MLNKPLKILLTGKSGLLASHIKLEADRPSREELDITKPIPEKYTKTKYDLIVHLAAYTNVEQAEQNKSEAFLTNCFGTLNLLVNFPDTPFVYMSSEYAYKPVNFYSTTKNFAEQIVSSHRNYLIIRTLFKAKPWLSKKAFVDKFTMGDYVDVIAPLVEKSILDWYEAGHKNSLIYVGTGRKTYYDLARSTKPDVIPNSIDDVKTVKIPKDYI